MYFVAVPIGNARDITLRALDILAGADVLAAEDTRALRRLMELHGVPLNGRQIRAYHEHNGARMRPALLEALAAGQSVAYASEAGTPLISDPGFDLARDAVASDLPVTAAPGASAVLTALNVAGLATDRFLFAGFLPSATTARRTALGELADVAATLVFYESPRRVAAMLADAAEVLGPDRPAATCRELTKKFEEVVRAPLGELAEKLTEKDPKGEFVVLIGKGGGAQDTDEDIETALRKALQTMSVRDAAEMVANAFGQKKRFVYQMALDLSKEG
ncbi:16S rRNA (cytidine(1402)-2'-O)-methyltransferase [Marinovum sp. 2_MG-2023]|uniref:16S rRNA (cytidine(1402)-2'-O)-methyltransferase n=1 Tax=unclassified Marinovum TaxID=2647166 RepID=UPI0026E20DCF|nr:MULTISPECIES: 16S rRNA (cytidine(1402)-2'-O)-methyltransferase [unclassified Marinovum]MDO6729890.1 16S rRNA (cytidine(1402)-2'-O)-methyltransferase [Marinovum sp. 2_MG-2023]MDO6779704.1 16S rRNA (cytidine(1402)-2'-O)-methyltransferase [Marinovum sp. 1_MG-2023]